MPVSSGNKAFGIRLPRCLARQTEEAHRLMTVVLMTMLTQLLQRPIRYNTKHWLSPNTNPSSSNALFGSRRRHRLHISKSVGRHGLSHSWGLDVDSA